METNPKTDWFFNKATKWQKEYLELRKLMLDTGLSEELKWGVPCYTLNNSNIILIHGFKDYCALLFHKGVLLKDDDKILIQQTENVQAGRQIRFKSLSEILEQKARLRAYIFEAIEIEKAGVKVQMKTTREFSVPEEFQQVIDQRPELKAAFENLTPGRQRGYLLYFSSAKQSKTRKARIEKHAGKILAGKGLED